MKPIDIADYLVAKGAVKSGPLPAMLRFLEEYRRRDLLLHTETAGRVTGVMLVRRGDRERYPINHDEQGTVLHLDEVALDSPELLPQFAVKLAERFRNSPFLVVGYRKGVPHVFPYARILRHFAV